MSSIVVVGAQWGDEGKGKLVDYLTVNADWTVRFQGGNNAGHTLVVNGVKTKLSLVPSGILRQQTKCVIAAGLVVDPLVLIKELKSLESAGVKLDRERFLIDRDASIIMNYHIIIDNAREEKKGDLKIGTTGRGIGPAYEERAARCAIRFSDLFDQKNLENKLKNNIENWSKYLKFVLESKAEINLDEVLARLEATKACLGQYVSNCSLIIDNALNNGDKVLFEGAQGTLLDQTFGTVPYVTSSHTLAGAVTTGCGVGAKRIEYVLGVAKAYSTRVGSGPYPTEIEGEIGDLIRDKGGEFGTVTGRSRRCGWLDAVALRRAVRLNGVDSLALTKLDVLSGLEKIKICSKYLINGKELDDVPALLSEFENVTPEYIEVDGWGDDLLLAKSFNDLPINVKKFINLVEELCRAKVSIVSFGAEREATIYSDEAKEINNFMK